MRSNIKSVKFGCKMSSWVGMEETSEGALRKMTWKKSSSNGPFGAKCRQAEKVDDKIEKELALKRLGRKRLSFERDRRAYSRRAKRGGSKCDGGERGEKSSMLPFSQSRAVI